MSVLSIRTKLAVLAISTLAACSTDDGVTPPPGPAPVASIVVTPAEIYLPIGVAMDLQVQLKAADGTVLQGRAITYTSGSAAVATVSPAGRITGVAEGITTITVRSEGKQAIVPIVVAEVVPAVERIVMSRATVVLAAGQMDALDATAVDAEGTILADVDITWSSSNPAVVTVSANGQIQAHSAGQAVVHAYGGDKIGSTVVTVLQPVPLPTVTQFEFLGIGGTSANRTVKIEEVEQTDVVRITRETSVAAGTMRWQSPEATWAQELVVRVTEYTMFNGSGSVIARVISEQRITDGGAFLFRWPGDFIDLASQRTGTTLTARMLDATMLRVRLPLDGIGEVELDFVKRN